MTRSTIVSGRVSDFDPAVGLGTIRGDDGHEYQFHCVEIADGSREIGVGTTVAFTVLHKLGCREAAGIHGLRR